MRVFRTAFFVMTALAAAQATAQDKAKIQAGETVYNNYCQTCHGDRLVSSGQTFDLRRLRAEDRARFELSVVNGKGQMPPWKGVLDTQQIDQVWNYVLANTNQK
ncbi:MAG: cytochrome c [Betaproteobacteria bacterium]|nr:cytochrome c [Betaproteobacteria bacterium]